VGGLLLCTGVFCGVLLPGTLLLGTGLNLPEFGLGLGDFGGPGDGFLLMMGEVPFIAGEVPELLAGDLNAEELFIE